MHSFQPSRGRILFEFLCALGIVASCVGAWKQTGASALLLAAFVAGLYGFVRLLDLSRPRAAVAAFAPDSQPEVEPAPAPQPDIHAFLKAVGPEPVADDAPVALVEFAAQAEPVELAPAEAAETAPLKPRRKSGGRKPKVAAEAKVVELVPPEEVVVPELTPEAAEVVEPAPDEEVADLLLSEEAEFGEFAETEDTSPSPIAPLFEPEPFARMQRRAFGRRGRL